MENLKIIGICNKCGKPVFGEMIENEVESVCEEYNI